MKAPSRSGRDGEKGMRPKGDQEEEEEGREIRKTGRPEQTCGGEGRKREKRVGFVVVVVMAAGTPNLFFFFPHPPRARVGGLDRHAPDLVIDSGASEIIYFTQRDQRTEITWILIFSASVLPQTAGPVGPGPAPAVAPAAAAAS